MKMDDRKQNILLAVIQDYIATAEPVGSRTISRKYKLGISPATVRNEMADLEDMGLIEQPYTSAGRIPTDKGYRHYVDYYMERKSLNEEIQQYIHDKLRGKLSDLEEVIRRTGDLLSGMTDCIAITLGPRLGKSAIKYIELTKIDCQRGLLVVVTDSGTVEHRFLDIPETVTKEDLLIASKVLANKFKGFTLDTISKTVLHEVYAELRLKRQFLDLIFDLIDEIFYCYSGVKIYMCGTHNILKQPEFKDVDKLHSLLTLLEEERIVKEILELPPEGIEIRIGEENTYEGVHDCSLVTATYSMGKEIIGPISVLGPTRMEYSKIVSIVDFISEALTVALTRYYG